MIRNYATVLLAIILKCKNWPSIIFAKLSNREIESIILRNGISIFIGGQIGKADLSMFSEIFYKEYYNPEGFEIKNNDVVFDVGANNGFFSYYASQKASEGTIYAFEPIPSLIEKINTTIKLNSLKNIKVINSAIGNSIKSPISFYVSREHNGCHSLYKREGSMDKIDVEIIDLKKYCSDKNISKIDFLKLDCEGAEYEIINEDNIDFIKTTVDKISMEYHDNINEHKHQEIIDILSREGFKTNISEGYIYAKNGEK